MAAIFGMGGKWDFLVFLFGMDDFLVFHVFCIA